MADIFISYAREDRETAERLAQALEDEGWSVWWDRHIPAGKRFDEVISASLDGAKCVIALWSQAAIASQWVAEEAEEGRERGVLLPAMIEAVEPPLGFRRIHAADLIGWRGSPDHAGLRQLIGDICQVMSTTETAPAAPAGSAAAASPPARKPTPTAPRRGRLPLFVGAGALVLAMGLVVAWSAMRSPPASDAGRKITVDYQSGGGDTSATSTRSSLDGRWRGTVAYDWGPHLDETFSFRAVGDTLTGSAGFLGVARGIVDGTYGSRSLRFAVRWQETLGSEQHQVTNWYVGTVNGEQIDMVLTIDGSFSAHPPISFTLTRAGE